MATFIVQCTWKLNVSSGADAMNLFRNAFYVSNKYLMEMLMWCSDLSNTRNAHNFIWILH